MADRLNFLRLAWELDYKRLLPALCLSNVPVVNLVHCPGDFGMTVTA